MLENYDYPFPCQDQNCNKRFKRNDHLKRHFEAVHSQIKYTCNICGTKMSRKDHLKRHMRNVHPMTQSYNNDGTNCVNQTCVDGEQARSQQNGPKTSCNCVICC